MATWKIEAKKEYGQFSHRLFKASDAPGEFSKPVRTVAELLDGVDGALKKAKVGAQDSLVFRNIAYDSAAELREAMRTAPY